jgi:hypothetical protein
MFATANPRGPRSRRSADYASAGEGGQDQPHVKQPYVKQPCATALAVPRAPELCGFHPRKRDEGGTERRTAHSPSVFLPRLLAKTRHAFRRSIAAFSLRRRAALSAGAPFALRVSQLLAGTLSGPGRSPDAARVPVCETGPRAPHLFRHLDRLRTAPLGEQVKRKLFLFRDDVNPWRQGRAAYDASPQCGCARCASSCVARRPQDCPRPLAQNAPGNIPPSSRRFCPVM